MKPTVEEIGNLLALKRHERPEDGYFDDFLREFHHRRRVEEAGSHGLSGFWKKTTSWIADLGAPKWAYGAGLAYAAVTAAFLLVPNAEPVSSMPPTKASYESRTNEAIEVEQLQALDLRPSSQGTTGEQEF